MKLSLLLLLATASLWGQTYTLGTANDPCTGGTPYTITATGSTQRYGNFTCTLAVPADGAYEVTFTFQEPCIGAYSCNPPVTGAGQRALNIYLNDAPALMSLDPWLCGARTADATVSRTALAYASGGQIVVRVQTVLRNAVLSTITVTPGIHSSAPGGSRLFISAGSAPTDTTAAGCSGQPCVYDAVIYLDPSTLTLKMLRKDGSTVPLTAQVQNCQGGHCAGLALITVPEGQYVGIVPDASFPKLPVCGSDIALPCWK